MTAKQNTGIYAPDGSLYITLTDGAGSLVSLTALGVETATSLALGGATIGTNALAVTGTSSFSGVAGFLGGNNTTIPAIYGAGATNTGIGLSSATDVDIIVGGTRTVYFDTFGVNAITDFKTSANVQAKNTTALTAGGVVAMSMGTSNTGIYFGSGPPTVSAAQGSIYLRSDGSSTSTRFYVNTNGSTTWTNVTTAA